MFHRAIKTGVICAVTLCTVTGAAVEDSKVYHAAFCKGFDWNHDYRFVGGELRAQGTATVTCPLIRDNTGGSQDLRSVWVELFHSSNAVSICTLNTLVEDDEAEVLDSEVETTPTGSGYRQIAFGVMQTSTGNEGAYNLVCTLASGSRLRQITVKED